MHKTRKHLDIRSIDYKNPVSEVYCADSRVPIWLMAMARMGYRMTELRKNCEIITGNVSRWKQDCGLWNNFCGSIERRNCPSEPLFAKCEAGAFFPKPYLGGVDDLRILGFRCEKWEWDTGCRSSCCFHGEITGDFLSFRGEVDCGNFGEEKLDIETLYNSGS